MSKAGILILTLLLVAAMFTGCRRGESNTTNSTTSTSGTTGTHATTKPTVPSTAATSQPSTGVIPDATDLMPQPSSSTKMPRGQGTPRF